MFAVWEPEQVNGWCERQSSHRVSLCVYLWKQRNSENKDPISVITSNNSLVGFASVRPLGLSLLYRAESDLNLRQLLYSYYTVLKHTEERTYGRSACKYIKSLFSFLIKIQKLTISIKAWPSTKNRGGLLWRRAVQLSICHTEETSVCPDRFFPVNQLLISL